MICLAVLVYVLRIMWACDDAFITFRVIDNFITGYGLRWNIMDRVQVYTHPLWMLLNIPAFAFIDEPIMASSLVSLLCVLAMAWVMAKVMPTSVLRFALGFVLPLGLSFAVTEFAISGLENPLSYLCFACLMYWLHRPLHPRIWFWVPLCASLAVLNRMDFALICLPICIWFLANHRPIRWRQLALAAIPFASWHLFAFLYYGFFLPTTATAKLAHDIPQAKMIQQGIYYTGNFLAADPIGGIAILFATIMAVIHAFGGGLKKPETRYLYLTMMLGVWLYIGYIIHNGGDFMSGRFFSVPVFISIALLYMTWSKTLSLLQLACLLLALGGIRALPYIDRSLGRCQPCIAYGKSITNERVAYRRNVVFRKGFLNPIWQPKHPAGAAGHQLKATHPTITMSGHHAGMRGYYGGARLHIIDHYAITSPLLSRIKQHRGSWRLIGHIKRASPKGYRYFIQTGSTERMAPDIGLYTEKLNQVIAGDIWSVARFETMWNFQLGRYDHLINSPKQ